MKEYTVAVEIKVYAEVSVFAESAEEAENAAWDMATLDDAYNWEVCDVSVEEEDDE